MRFGYRLSLAVIAILMVMTMFLGSSYALWKATAEQTTDNVITSGCFSVAFEGISPNINLDNTYPVEDNKGLNKIPYTFTLTNNCNIDASYTLYLNQLNNSSNNYLDEQYIDYSINKVDSAVKSKQNLKTNGKKNTNLDDFQNKNQIKQSYQLDTGKLKGKKDETTSSVKAGESVTYELRLWIDSAATTAINGKSFNASIAVVAVATQIEEGTNINATSTDENKVNVSKDTTPTAAS